MKCESCGVNIGAEFVFALKSNKCPACGENIMAGAKLASFLSLQTLLQTNFKELDAEKAASLIVANFELSQIFKDGGVQQTVATTTVIVKQPMTEDHASDEEYKRRQAIESKAVLQKLRDEALEGAQADQWGLGNANTFVEEAEVREIAHFQERQQQTENIVSGNRGAFRRT